jgi:hypothetical protein
MERGFIIYFRKMKWFLIICTTTLLLFCSACEKVKSKTKAITIGIAKEVLNIVSPRFDDFTPDTKYNKKRFADFLKVELTPDIKNIYCFNDEIGIDASYQFGFNCNYQTAQKIIAKHSLRKDSTALNSTGIQYSFSWWDVNKVAQLTLYSNSPGRDYYQYFWYDSLEQKAYYLDFDM